jgi:putative membrane protein
MPTLSTIRLLADANGWNGHMGWGGNWWMAIWGTFLMVGLVVLVVWLVRSTATGGPGPHPNDPSTSARQILGERYARGEISTEDYRERLDELARR